ncbi:MAG: IPT/TIG domain-containing protein, partial [Comamonadaceae bacterium]|nr:IPT/TIG domain-containing protein [Comamonadaceae bacterium]
VAVGTVITLQGTNFVPGTLVSVGGLPATNIEVINATTLTATVPAYVSGSLVKDVVVNNGVSSATLASGFTYTDNAPTLTQITPTTGSINGGTTVTLTGSGFSPGTSVTFGGTLASSVTIINATTLTAVTPAYTNGSLTVDVVVDNGVSNATLTGGFTYQAMAPSLSTITPNNGPLAGGTTITLNGSGFTPGTQVTIGSVPALSITVTNSTTLTAVVPTYISGNLAKDVTVDNGQGSATVNAGFTYVVSTPTLATVTPITGNTAGGATITLLGSGFVPGSVVLVDGINAANVQVINSTTLTAVTPAHAAGTVDVTINNGAGTAALTNAFTYSNLAPGLSN